MGRYGAMTREALSPTCRTRGPVGTCGTWSASTRGEAGRRSGRPSASRPRRVRRRARRGAAVRGRVELLHNAFLVHDDIEDDSRCGAAGPRCTPARRAAGDQRGDALVVLAGAALRDNRRRLGSRLASRIGEEFELMARRTLEGQALELGWRRDGVCDLTPDDYLDLIMHKTCWYTTIHPLRVGALIGSLGRSDLDSAGAVRLLPRRGVPDPGRPAQPRRRRGKYGKELCGDLYEGKRTLMLIHLSGKRGARPPSRRRFLAMERPQRTPGDVAGMVELMRRYGSMDFARAFGLGIAEAATDAFEVAFDNVPDSPERRFIHDLIAWMLERDA